MQPGADPSQPSGQSQDASNTLTLESLSPAHQPQKAAISIRLADLVVALIMAAFSIYLMIESAKLPIGYFGSEVGAGTFPFWMSLGMLVCCLWIIINWIQRKSSPSRSVAPFMSYQGARRFVSNASLLFLTLLAIRWIGMYGAVPLFLIAQLRFLGRHSWKLAGSFAVLTPIVMFLFFEIGLKITLPKGYTEPLFYPLYQFFF